MPTGTETVRLADVFVRLPNGPHQQQQNDKPTAPPEQTKVDSGEVSKLTDLVLKTID